MYLEAVFRFYVLLNHFIGHFFFGLVRFGSFSNTIYRNLALALSKLHINVDITVGFFVGQKNYRLNIRLANERLNGILIRPGETFSFWHRVGKTTKRKGYRDGRILVRNHILPGIGGGLCNLANTIHRVVLVSPLTVTEFHKHSDALAPDEGPRVPFSSGTSVFYNNGDYRFKNEMDQTFQLLLWCDEDNLYAELRCERPLPCRYHIVEEGHHFQKEGGKYYRVSKIYKETLDVQTGQLLHRELVLDNHSEVMYDPALIPGVEKL